MNDSISSMSPLDRSFLSQGLSYTEESSSGDVIGTLSIGNEEKEITHHSDISPIESLADQVGRSCLDEVTNSVGVDEFGDEEFFGDEEDPINEEVEVEIMKQKGAIDEQEVSLEKQEVSVKTNDGILKTNRKKTNIELLRNRTVNTEDISIVRDNFIGDLALQFALQKPGNREKISALTEGFTYKAEGRVDRSRILQSIDRGSIDQAAQRAMALKINTVGEREFTEEDAKKAADKATKLLRPHMKDKQGKPIDDAQFYLIQEEITKDFCSHIISLGLIQKKENESTKKEELNQKNPLNNKEVQNHIRRTENTANGTREVNKSSLNKEFKRGKEEITRGWDRLSIERDLNNRIREEKIRNQLNKKLDIKKEEIDKEIIRMEEKKLDQ